MNDDECARVSSSVDEGVYDGRGGWGGQRASRSSRNAECDAAEPPGRRDERPRRRNVRTRRGRVEDDVERAPETDHRQPSMAAMTIPKSRSRCAGRRPASTTTRPRGLASRRGAGGDVTSVRRNTTRSVAQSRPAKCATTSPRSEELTRRHRIAEQCDCVTMTAIAPDHAARRMRPTRVMIQRATRSARRRPRAGDEKLGKRVVVLSRPCGAL